MTLTVVVVAEDFEAPVLCGRSAVDWLLDTVEELAPDTLVVTGVGIAAVHELIRRRPVLASIVDVVAGDGCTVTLSTTVPLIRPVTLRRAIDLVAHGTSRVSVELNRRVDWWADEAEPGPWIHVSDGGPDTGTVSLFAGPVESLQVDNPTDRARAERALYRKIAADWQARGVVVDDPQTTRVDATVRIGAGTRIHPNTELLGDTVIGAGCELGPTVTVRESTIGADCLVQYAVVQFSQVGDRANLGPFCWIRSNTRLGADARAGAFVELADSTIGDGTSIPHMGGLFSADVGRDCNIAGGSASANFSGGRKSRVRLGDNVSIGANNILVAPLTIGDGASTAAGSVITMDVPAGAVGVARAPQRNFPGQQLKAVGEASPPVGGEVTALPLPAGDVTALPQPVGEVSVLPLPAGDVTALPQPVGEVSVLPKPVGDVTALPKSVGDVTALRKAG
jgi:serine acetyltransferase